MPSSIKPQTSKSVLDLIKEATSVSNRIDFSQSRKWKTAEDVTTWLKTEVTGMISMADFSYDPIVGEIIFSFSMEINMLVVTGDNDRVGDIVRDFFTNEGFDSVVIIPHRSGIPKSLVKLRSTKLQTLRP